MTRCDFIKHALTRVANLNPVAGEIGDGMLHIIVEECKQALLDYESDSRINVTSISEVITSLMKKKDYDNACKLSRALMGIEEHGNESGTC